MRGMRIAAKFAAIVALAICGANLVRAQATRASASNASISQAASASLPTADQVLDKYVQAIGGRAAWEKLHSRTSLGTIEIPTMNLSGTVMVHEKAPNSMLLVVILSGNSFRQGFDGTVAWSDDPQNGVQVKSGQELTETVRDADFYHPIDMKKIYAHLAVTGSDTIAGEAVWVMEATTADGATDKIYFEKGSGLIRRVEGQHHSPQGTTKFVEDIEDYQEIDGVKLPYTVKQSSGDSIFTIHFGQVQHNVALDNAEFSKPAAQ